MNGKCDTETCSSNAVHNNTVKNKNTVQLIGVIKNVSDDH